MENKTIIIVSSLAVLAVTGFIFKDKIIALYEKNKKENRDIVLTR